MPPFLVCSVIFCYDLYYELYCALYCVLYCNFCCNLYYVDIMIITGIF